MGDHRLDEGKDIPGSIVRYFDCQEILPALLVSAGFFCLSLRPVPVPNRSQRFLGGGTRMPCRITPAAHTPMHTHRRYLPGRQGIQFSMFSGRSTSPSTNPRKNHRKGTTRDKKAGISFLCLEK